jgi:DNA-binding CsgD family transcriptional regulator
MSEPVEKQPDARAARNARSLALLAHAERIAGLGSWEWTPETGELIWSDNLYRIYGLEPGAITPSGEWLRAHILEADRALFIERVREVVGGGTGAIEAEYRFRRPDGSVRTLLAVVAMSEDAPTGGRRVIGSVQDLTRERRLERVLELRVAVSNALEAWSDDESGLQSLVAAPASAGFVFSTFWVTADEDFRARACWHAGSSEMDWLAAVTRAWRPGLNSAIIGRASRDHQPVCSEQIAASAPPDRRAALRAAGIRSALAIPAVFSGETLGVLELLDQSVLVSTDRLTRILYGMGHELGHFLGGHRGALTPLVLTNRELQVVQLAARGYGTEAIATELGVSPATVKRHFERAYAELGVSDRAAAVGTAMRRGLIT